MKNSISKIAFFVVLSIFFASCEDDQTIPAENASSIDLNGAWEWTGSIDGLHGSALSPNIRPSHTLVFNDGLATLKVDDGSGNSLIVRINEFELVPQDGSFRLVFGEDRIKVVPNIQGILNFSLDPLVVSIDKDNLVLADNCEDCYIHTFNRKE